MAFCATAISELPGASHSSICSSDSVEKMSGVSRRACSLTSTWVRARLRVKGRVGVGARPELGLTSTSCAARAAACVAAAGASAEPSATTLPTKCSLISPTSSWTTPARPRGARA
eukprot:scaffold13765_cov64-Phaeocystis_antarctica.AAC.3